MHTNLLRSTLSSSRSIWPWLAGRWCVLVAPQRSLEQFFLAKQSMSWLPVGLSLWPPHSAIDLSDAAVATIRYGLILVVGTQLVAVPLSVGGEDHAAVLSPSVQLTRTRYLEARFDVRSGRRAGIFIVWRLGWMATAIYVPCLAIRRQPMARCRGADDSRPRRARTVYAALGGVEA